MAWIFESAFSTSTTIKVRALPSFPEFAPPPTTDDVRPFFRGELKALNAAVVAALPRATDRETTLHLEDIKDQIAKVLDPKIAPSAAPSAGGPQPGLDFLRVLCASVVFLNTKQSAALGLRPRWKRRLPRSDRAP